MIRSAPALEPNLDDAVAPEAILGPGSHKPPVSDNDPTRDVSPGAKSRRLIGVAFAYALMLALSVAAIAVLLRRT